MSAEVKTEKSSSTEESELETLVAGPGRGKFFGGQRKGGKKDNAIEGKCSGSCSGSCK